MGVLSRDLIFGIRNTEFNAAIALESVPPLEGGAVTLNRPADSLGQMWRITEDGRIVARLPREARVHGITKDVSFAMAVNLDSGQGKDSYPIVLQQLGTSENQIWEDSGSGEIINRALGSGYVLDAESGQRLVLKKRSSENKVSRLWRIDEFPEGLDVTLKEQARATRYFKLRSDDGSKVLTIQGGESCPSLDARLAYSVVAQPDINGRHQLWSMNEDGDVVSAMPAKVDNRKMDMLLSVPANSKTVIAECYNPRSNQRWKDTNVAGLSLLSGKHETAFVSEQTANSVSNQGNVIVLETDAASRAQKWKRDFFAPRSPVSIYEPMVTKVISRKHKFDVVDTRPLVVDGIVGSIRLDIVDVTSFFSQLPFTYTLRLAVTVIGSGDVKTLPNDYDRDEIHVARNVTINPNILILPPSKIYAIKLTASGKEEFTLGLAYQHTKNGPWAGLQNESKDKYIKLTEQGRTADVAWVSVSSDRGPVVGVGLMCNSDGSYLSAKALQQSGRDTLPE